MEPIKLASCRKLVSSNSRGIPLRLVSNVAVFARFSHPPVTVENESTLGRSVVFGSVRQLSYATRAELSWFRYPTSVESAGRRRRWRRSKLSSHSAHKSARTVWSPAYVIVLYFLTAFGMQMQIGGVRYRAVILAFGDVM